MVAPRIVATLPIVRGWVVQSIGFRRYLPVGRPTVIVEFLNRFGIDEVVLLDIHATRDHRRPDVDLVRSVSRKGFVPLTVGGGVRDLEDVRRLVAAGADKVAMQSAVLVRPELIADAAAVFGDQCIVIAMDVQRRADIDEVVTDSAQQGTGRDPVAWAQCVAAQGAGEILLTAVDRDGAKRGYDCDLIARVARAVAIPVIAAGGVGHPMHFRDAFAAGASAAAAGNFFHFTEHSPITTKQVLRQGGLDVRLDTAATYEDASFLADGRCAKRDDVSLDALRFSVITPEVL